VRVALVIVAAAIVFVSGAQASVGDMSNHGGPELESPNVYVVVWLPAGRHIDSGNDAAVESRLHDAIEHLSGTHFLGVLTQYGATNRIQFGGLWVDTTPYPHAGTTGDPLQVSDYANSVRRAMASNGWQPGLDKLYLVYTANETEACGLGSLPSGGRNPSQLFTPQDCTFPNSNDDVCSVHSYFMQSGEPVAYAAIPFPAAGDCIPPAGSVADPNNDVPLDYVLSNAALFISAMIVDPLGNAWYTTNPEAGRSDASSWRRSSTFSSTASRCRPSRSGATRRTHARPAFRRCPPGWRSRRNGSVPGARKP
jgi:hypothetical protein